MRIFVAMPGTDMGPNAKYTDPGSVKRNLLEPVAKKLREELGCSVDLVIEKEKAASGSIHRSMFADARDADVFIADLTGANPNVYLELGVRWALRDCVTVLIAQSAEDLKFNVEPSRAILYNPDNLIEVIDLLVVTIKAGLGTLKCDSLVRESGDLVTVAKSKLERYEQEIARLGRERGEDLLREARAAAKSEDKISLLDRALEANPAFVEAIIEMGIAYREMAKNKAKYSESVKMLEQATRLDPGNALAHRELGVSYGKLGRLDLAVEHLREAVRLYPEDSEAWSNLGGAYRRIGMRDAPGSFDQNALVQARDSYDSAHKLKKYDLYSGLNVARLDVLLLKWKGQKVDVPVEAFRKQLHLCRHEAEENSGDGWRQFDLADALLFSGNFDEAHEAYARGIAVLPEDERTDTIRSVLGPLQDFLTADVLAGDFRINVGMAVETLKASM